MSQLDRLTYFMDKAGTSLDPAGFYDRVNRAFHDCEAEDYDEIHKDMFEFLEQKFCLLFSKIIHERTIISPTSQLDQLRVLDIGAGTGLAEHFIEENYGRAVGHVSVVDPNEKMTNKLLMKAKDWSFNISIRNCYLEEAHLAPSSFDVVICSSVLHHVPDLQSFFRILCPLVKPNGFLLTMQDPNAEAHANPLAQYRKNEYLVHSAKRDSELSVSAQIKKSIHRWFPFVTKIIRWNTLESRVNRILLGQRVIVRPLTMKEIWGVTDIHVPNQPGSIGEGISKIDLENWLSKFSCVDYLTYNYFDADLLGLAPTFAQREAELFEKKDQNGFLFTSLFRNNS